MELPSERLAMFLPLGELGDRTLNPRGLALAVESWSARAKLIETFCHLGIFARLDVENVAPLKWSRPGPTVDGETGILLLKGLGLLEVGKAPQDPRPCRSVSVRALDVDERVPLLLVRLGLG